MAPALETGGAARTLQAAWRLELERRQEDIHHSEAQLRAALVELELARGEEERRVAQRTAVMQREHDARMAALERRFLTDAEALQVQFREGVEHEVQRGQAALDVRAREMLGALGHSGLSAHSACSPGARSPSAARLPASQGGSPATAAAPASAAAPPSKAKAGPPFKATPSPAVLAAGEAIAALRMGMPGRAGATLSLPASAASCTPSESPGKALAAGQAHTTVAASPVSSPSAGQSLALPVPPTGMPNTAAAMRALLLRSPAKPQAPSPHAPQQGLPQPPSHHHRSSHTGQAAAAASTRSTPPPASMLPQGQQVQATGGGWHDPAPVSVPAGASAAAAAAAPQEARGELARRNPPLAHDSSSEFDDELYCCDEESSGELDLTASRPPQVKQVNPRGSMTRSVSFVSPNSSDRCSGGGLPTSRPGSSGSRSVHLNISPTTAVSVGSVPGLPRLRAYSPCTCREGAAAAALPLGGAAGGGMLCVPSSSRLRATYTSD